MSIDLRLVEFIKGLQEGKLFDHQKLLLEVISDPRTRRIMTNKTTSSKVMTAVRAILLSAGVSLANYLPSSYREVKPKDFTLTHRGSVQGNSQYHNKTNKISRKKRGY